MPRDKFSERMRNQSRKKLQRKGYLDSDDFKHDKDAIESQMQVAGVSMNRLAALAGVSGSALSQSLAGKYTGNIGEVVDKTMHALDRLRNEEIAGAMMPFVETSVYKMIKYICDEAFAHRTTDSIGLVPANVGVGKTTSLKHYVANNSHAVYVRCSTGMGRKQIIEALMNAMRAATVGKTISAMQFSAVRVLENSPKLIILDEASKATNDVLECLRDISDSAECGLVFIGREYLAERLASNEGILGEISSRVLTRIDPIKRLKQEDVELIIGASAVGDASEDAKKMIWECSEANGRVLHRLMIKLSAYAAKKGIEELSKDIVSSIYHSYIKSHSPAWRTHQSA